MNLGLDESWEKEILINFWTCSNTIAEIEERQDRGIEIKSKDVLLLGVLVFWGSRPSWHVHRLLVVTIQIVLSDRLASRQISSLSVSHSSACNGGAGGRRARREARIRSCLIYLRRGRELARPNDLAWLEATGVIYCGVAALNHGWRAGIDGVRSRQTRQGGGRCRGSSKAICSSCSGGASAGHDRRSCGVLRGSLAQLRHLLDTLVVIEQLAVPAHFCPRLIASVCVVELSKWILTIVIVFILVWPTFGTEEVPNDAREHDDSDESAGDDSDHSTSTGAIGGRAAAAAVTVGCDGRAARGSGGGKCGRGSDDGGDERANGGGCRRRYRRYKR